MEAAAAYGRAHAAAPETTYGRLCGAKGLASEGRREAAALLRELVLRDAASSEGHLVLANVLSEAGKLEEAATHFERSIALAPWQTTAYQGLVASRRLTEEDRPLLARVESRLAEGKIAPRQRMMMHFAIGKGLDDLKDYAGAMGHFDSANQIPQGAGAVRQEEARGAGGPGDCAVHRGALREERASGGGGE